MNEARQFVIAIVHRLPLFLNFLIEGLSQLFDNKLQHVTNVLRSCMDPFIKVRKQNTFKCKILPIAADLIPLGGVDVITQYLHHPNQ